MTCQRWSVFLAFILKPIVTKKSKLDVPMNLVIGRDHMGFPLKIPLMELLRSWNHTAKDVGSFIIVHLT
jgi:hypothetical protein